MATGQRVVKHRHVVEEALGINAGEFAVLGVLLLRGAQTPGELKQRTERWHSFRSLDDVRGGARPAGRARARRSNCRAGPARRNRAGRNCSPATTCSTTVAGRAGHGRASSLRRRPPSRSRRRAGAGPGAARRRTRSRSATRRPARWCGPVAITEEGEIAQKVDARPRRAARVGRARRTTSAPRRPARVPRPARGRGRRVRAADDAGDGQADPPGAHRGRGGARAHRLERRARRRRDRAAHRDARRDPDGARHARAGRRRRAHERVELSRTSSG